MWFLKNAKILKIGPVEPKLRKIRQIVMGKFAEIRYCTIPHIADIRYCKNARPARTLKIRQDMVLYNTVYQCNKVMEEVDNTSSTFISVFFTDIQE